MDSFYEAFNDKNNTPSAWVQSEERMPPHFHNSLEFVGVAEGSMDIMVDGHNETLQKGQIMVAASLSSHSIYSNTPDGKYYCVQIPRDSVAEWNNLLDKSTFENISITDSFGILELMALMVNIYQSGLFEENSEAKASELRLLGSALTGLIIQCSRLVPRRKMTNIIARTVELINLRYREKLRLSDIADELLCSSQVLSLQFREVMGMSVTDYTNSLRVSELKRILTEDPEANLEEASERAGFQSIRTAYRCFEAAFGSTPGKFRQ